MSEIKPLKPGRQSIKDQAEARNEPVPVGLTVKELQERGYDVDPDWPLDGKFVEHAESPTGYALEERFRIHVAEYNLAH